jgi:Putative exonuclease SbcCD, C subunit/P-loop containing region of AAA domain
MNQRISLSRIIAINWYGFRQIIDVEETILMSGVSGTGKSALLDLVQRVLLGENWRPNRAAAGTARGRTEVSYVLCDTNTTRNGEPHYTRRSGASYIALEFTWPAAKGDPRRETWGWRIQYDSPTSDASRVYFSMSERADLATFTKGNELLGEDEFKTFIRREYGNDHLYSQREYLAEMATPYHLWFNEERLHKTMPKAIAFEPENNMETFIREFILEEAPIDVKDVRKSVVAYRETQERLLKQEDEAAFLRRVCDFHSIFETESRAAAIFAHLRIMLECAHLKEALSGHQARLEALDARHGEDNRAYEEKTAEVARLQKNLREFNLDADESELVSKRSEAHRKLLERNKLVEAQQSIRKRLRTLAQRWREWLERGGQQKLEGLRDALAVDENLLDALGSTDEAVSLDALPKMAARFSELFSTVGKLLEPVDTEIKAADTNLRGIAASLEKLEAGQTPGDFPLLLAVKQALARSPTPPEQLCRMIEVKPDAEKDGWRKALELVLGRNRFSIVVGSMDDFRTAMDLLRRQARGDELIVHPREALDLGSKVMPGSLAEKVEIGTAGSELRAIATSFVHHLIGRITAAESMEELDQAPDRAVTRDGIYKQKPTRRKLTQPEKLDFTLGKEGLKRLRETLVRAQQELMTLRAARLALRSEIHTWIETGKTWDLDNNKLPDRSGELYRLKDLQDELAGLSSRIEFLETPERAGRIKRREEMQDQERVANIAIGQLMTSRQGYGQQRKVIEDAMAATSARLKSQELEAGISRGKLPPNVEETGVFDQVEAFRSEFKTWEERKDAAKKREDSAVLKSAVARRDRDNERRAMIGAVNKDGRLRHPEYRHDYNPDDEDNNQWAARLRTLEEFELDKFRGLAADRRRDWERRLKEHVLNRLNDNIQTAERTVKDLRKYLDRQVRGHRYEISQKRDPAFSTLFSLLDTGFELSDDLAAVGRANEVQQAMNELMAAVEATDKADDRAKRLLDYRYYHRYDLEMINVGGTNGVKAQPISLGRSGVNLSGGENQAPFFISMLAAFRRVYDLGSGRSNHLGLVVMDEAFAKLSGDGVEDCLELAKEFDLQLLMAFPVDRLGVMAPFAQTIILCEKEEERDAAGYVTRVDNIPTRLTTEQALESLA